MKNLWISVKITLAMCLLLGVGYVLVLRGVSALAGPNGGQAETLTLDGRVVGAANVGQQFTGGRYFWGASLVRGLQRRRLGRQQQGYDQSRIPGRCGAARAGFPRGASLPLPRRGAFGNGDSQRFGPRSRHLAPRAQVQVRRVAAARGLDEAVVQRLVDSLTQKPWLGLFGTAKVNVLRLNIALETLQPNVTASAGVRQAGGCGEDVSPEN